METYTPDHEKFSIDEIFLDMTQTIHLFGQPLEVANRIRERIRDELKLNPNHRPHDGRTHFVTMAKRYGVDEYAIKYMVGHKISDITEKVYTRREFAWLREEIEKIK